ncbi:MAG: hypothetical protein MRY80_09910, partial [Oricola sp.]|nr:hypothetical protein [Oricola sp.]
MDVDRLSSPSELCGRESAQRFQPPSEEVADRCKRDRFLVCFQMELSHLSSLRMSLCPQESLCAAYLDKF